MPPPARRSSPTITVAQDAKTLTLTVVGQMGEIKIVFNMDGTEAKSPLEMQGMSIDRVTKSAWDGDKLVLTTISNFQGQTLETKQVWALNADGTLTIDMTRPDFQGGGAPTTTKTVYKKQQIGGSCALGTEVSQACQPSQAAVLAWDDSTTHSAQGLTSPPMMRLPIVKGVYQFAKTEPASTCDATSESGNRPVSARVHLMADRAAWRGRGRISCSALG